VTGFSTAENGKLLADMMAKLSRQGFVATWLVLNPLWFGIPQNRPRLFLIAIRAYPHPGKYQANRALKNVVARLERKSGSFPTLEDAIWDLPRLRAGDGGYVTVRPKKINKPNPYAKRMRNVWPTLFNHQARRHNEGDLRLYRLLHAGETAKEAVEKYGRDDLMRYGLDGFTDKYRKLFPHRAAPTLVAHLAKDANMFIHPRDHRGLTVREAARLQGIHDDFIFLGNLFEQFVQVGNAVPPEIAEEISRALLANHEGIA
jgi:DNA (cytosine-5)-methyltransferase 1